MIGQLLADGLILGATIALGAIGLTLTYNILDFANFSHAGLMSWGGYFALISVVAFTSSHIGLGTLGPLSFGWPLLVAIILSIAATGLLAILVDFLVFRMLRKSNIQIALVIASFGADLVLRNTIILFFGPEPRYYSHSIQIAREILPGIRVTPDQIFMVVLSVILVGLLHLFLTRTKLGKAMRAMADNPPLSQVSGINTAGVIRWTWIIGGGLAAVAGTFFGLTVQLLPDMGFILILPVFAAAILGGIGSVYGAVLGGLIIGVAQDLSVAVISPGYKPAIAFIIMILTLLIRPNGLLGEKK